MSSRSLGLVLALAVALGLATFLLRSGRERPIARGSDRGAPSSPGLDPEPVATPAAAVRSAPSKASLPEETPASLPGAASPPAPAGTRALAPGTIDGLVLRGGKPVGGGEAWLVRNDYPGDSRRCANRGPDAAAERTSVGADGTFRFSALAAGEYCVGVDVEPGTRRVQSIVVVEGQPTELWVIVLGSGEIRGQVWKTDGSFAIDVPVRFSLFARPPGTDSAAGAWVMGLVHTEVDGSYRLRGLEPGSYAVEVGLDVASPEARAGLAVDLGVDEVKTVDFGSPRGLAVWSGRLLTSNGAPLSLATSILLENRGAGTTLLVRTREDGAFGAEVAPGSYTLKAQLVMQEGREIGELVVTDRDLERDLRVPGAWVAITVRYVGSKGDPQAARRNLLVFLKGSGVHAMAQPGHDGRYHFLGLQPGDYEVWATTSPIASEPRETFALHVNAGESEIPMEITVGDP